MRQDETRDDFRRNAYEMINEMVRPTIADGQHSGELRSDVDIDAIIDYIVEQSYFATHAQDRSVRAVKKRFRLFIEPAISPSAAGCGGTG